MSERRSSGLKAAGVAIAAAAAAAVVWLGTGRSGFEAQVAAKPMAPLMSRGYTDAPAGTALLAGDSEGGVALKELRVEEGQHVKRGDVVAVLSGFDRADVTVKSADAERIKAAARLAAMDGEVRKADIAAQELRVRSAASQLRLTTLEVARTGKTPEARQLEVDLGQLTQDREQAILRQLLAALDTDRTAAQNDLAIAEAKLEHARAALETTLVRSPIDGVVVVVYARAGERVQASGILKIIDLSRMRVLAEVDEVHLERLRPGGRVDIAFRGSPRTHSGRIVRIVPAVNRMRRADPDGASSSDARVVQVELAVDDVSAIPQVVGREARVTFN